MLRLLLYPVLIASFVTSVRKGKWPIRPPAGLGKLLTFLKGNLNCRCFNEIFYINIVERMRFNEMLFKFLVIHQMVVGIE
jgi:hypothetical protein